MALSKWPSCIKIPIAVSVLIVVINQLVIVWIIYNTYLFLLFNSIKLSTSFIICQVYAYIQDIKGATMAYVVARFLGMVSAFLPQQN